MMASAIDGRLINMEQKWTKIPCFSLRFPYMFGDNYLNVPSTLLESLFYLMVSVNTVTELPRGICFS